MLRWSAGSDSRRRSRRKSTGRRRPAFGQSSHLIGGALERRRLLAIEGLEDRLVLATFADAAPDLTLTLAANDAVGIVANASTYTLTLTSGTWSGADDANVAGNGTATLTVQQAAFTQVNLGDGGANTSVAFNDSGANAYNANFTIALHDGPASPGLTLNGASSFGAFNLAANVDTTIDVSSGADLSTTSGQITLDANQGATPTPGNFDGINVSGATVTSATGSILLQGKGGGSGGDNYGIALENGAVVSSTGAGAGAATITLIGTSGAGTAGNLGILLSDAGTDVTSLDGAIQLTGTG